LVAPRWIGHDLLLREAVLSGVLRNVEPLRIGAGRTPAKLAALTDLELIRITIDGKPTPYVPGSSLKGLIRTIATRLARSKGLRVCEGLSKQNCIDRFRDEFKRLVEDPSKAIELRKFIWEKTCLLCKVFGAPSYLSHTFFSDAYPIGEPMLGVKPGVAISRRTGTVKRGSLFFIEYVAPGCKFPFEVRVTNLPNYALALLAACFIEVHEGRERIGGFKTRGFGRVRLEDLKLSLWGEIEFRDDVAILKPLDDHDFEFNVGKVGKQDNKIVIEGNEATRLLYSLAKAWYSFNASKVEYPVEG